MVKRKNKTKRVNKIGWINTFLPLDSKMKIQSLINHLKTSHVTFTSQMDIAICNSITDDRLRFYYDTIRPPIVIFNTPKTGRKKSKGGITIDSPSKNGLEANDPIKKVSHNDNLLRRQLSVNRKDVDDSYEYGLSDW